MTTNKCKLLAKCEHLAYSPSILNCLEEEIRKHGFAGSANVPKLVYLTFLTGVLEKPVSLVLKGPSGVGKSFSLRAAQQFVRAEAYEHFEGMSEKAIVYLGLNLNHKHLVLSEAAGMAQGTGRALLRQLLSEGKVRYATVESTNEGLTGKQLPTLEGPCGLIMTTTANALHPEDESRMLSVNITESPDQIRAALMAQADGQSASHEQPDLEPWFQLYDLVKQGPRDAVVPFAPALAMKLPTTSDRIKRDFPHVQSLIKASALLHSCSRDREEGGRIIARIDDYATVRDLVNESISEGLGVAVPDPVRRAVEGVQTLQAEKKLPVGLGELAGLLNRDRSAVSRVVERAIQCGYLENQNPGQGREAQLVLGHDKLPSGLILPPPEELAATEGVRVPAEPKPAPKKGTSAHDSALDRLLETVS